jgi:hypothetical protein
MDSCDVRFWYIKELGTGSAARYGSAGPSTARALQVLQGPLVLQGPMADRSAQTVRVCPANR